MPHSTFATRQTDFLSLFSLALYLQTIFSWCRISFYHFQRYKFPSAFSKKQENKTKPKALLMKVMQEIMTASTPDFHTHHSNKEFDLQLDFLCYAISWVATIETKTPYGRQSILFEREMVLFVSPLLHRHHAITTHVSFFYINCASIYSLSRCVLNLENASTLNRFCAFFFRVISWFACLLCYSSNLSDVRTCVTNTSHSWLYYIVIQVKSLGFYFVCKQSYILVSCKM